MASASRSGGRISGIADDGCGVGQAGASQCVIVTVMRLWTGEEDTTEYTTEYTMFDAR
jgi:hypothetical protein